MFQAILQKYQTKEEVPTKVFLKQESNLNNSLILTRYTHLMQQFIYHYKQLYMFRASICPSSGVLGCIRIIPGYKTYTSAQVYTPAPQNLSHNT